MSERKLASIQKILEVKSIPNADRIDAYKINGWWVVDQKGKYEVGDEVVYCEVDSWIPSILASFLSRGKEPKEYKGIKGERLRTIKLKGQISQGLILHLPTLIKSYLVGDDVSNELGIIKWEKPIPAQLRGKIKGNFPSFFPKTDQERVQNIPEEALRNLTNNYLYQVTEKLDGSSMSIYYNENEYGVTSRNIDLKLDQEGNSFVDTFLNLKEELDLLTTRMKNYGTGNFVVQGELCGEKIQGNSYALDELTYYVFDIFDIEKQEYLPPNDVVDLLSNLDINYVPVIIEECDLVGCNVDQILKEAENISQLNNVPREGLVFKSLDRKSSFKAISNKWLLKNE